MLSFRSAPFSGSYKDFFLYTQYLYAFQGFQYIFNAMKKIVVFYSNGYIDHSSNMIILCKFSNNIIIIKISQKKKLKQKFLLVFSFVWE